MPTKAVPIRRGKPIYLTLDADAVGLLQAMTPNSKARGLLLSELVRREAAWREERSQLLAALAEAVQEPTAS